MNNKQGSFSPSRTSNHKLDLQVPLLPLNSVRLVPFVLGYIYIRPSLRHPPHSSTPCFVPFYACADLYSFSVSYTRTLFCLISTPFLLRYPTIPTIALQHIKPNFTSSHSCPLLPKSDTRHTVVLHCPFLFVPQPHTTLFDLLSIMPCHFVQQNNTSISPIIFTSPINHPPRLFRQ